MKIAIIGCGAMGSVYAALLADYDANWHPQACSKYDGSFPPPSSVVQYVGRWLNFVLPYLRLPGLEIRCLPNGGIAALARGSQDNGLASCSIDDQ